MAEMSTRADAVQDIRPKVAKATSGKATLVFAAILLAAGGGLFYALQMRRMDLTNPSLVTPQAAGATTISSPPDLVIPPMPNYPQLMPGQAGYAMIEGAPAYGVTGMPPPRTAPAVQGYPSEPYGRSGGGMPASAVPMTPPPAAPPTGAGFAYQASGQGLPTQPENGTAEKTKDTRVLASRLENQGMTVPQGSVIQAVMETALDSTRAGFARAIVSRDVMSFDGARVLIPKGSRLFGEYQADVNLGQKRALIQWKRLTRPDGTIIALDSPAADPLGRAGVRGKVNTHFLERFGGTILQSVLDLGVRAATSEATNNTVIIGAPSAATQGSLVQQQGEIKPTLKVRQGASIAVFVARDLDFSSVE